MTPMCGVKGCARRAKPDTRLCDAHFGLLVDRAIKNAGRGCGVSFCGPRPLSLAA